MIGSHKSLGQTKIGAVYENRVVLVDHMEGLVVVDISNETAPTGILHAPGSPRAIEIQSAEGEPSGILAGAGGGQLQICDATNPAMPVKAATFETPGRSLRVAMAGSLIYVADGQAGVTIVDISNPSAPMAAGTFQTDAPAQDISATDTHVFVVVGAGEPQDGETEVQILRRSS